MRFNVKAGAGHDMAGDCAAFILSDENQRCILLSLPVKYIGLEGTQKIAAAVGEACDTSPDRVITIASDTGDSTMRRENDDEYTPQLLESAVDAAKRAEAELSDVAFGTGSAFLPHLVYNHRLTTRNMRVVTHWCGVPKGEVLGVEGSVDPELSALVFRRPDGSPLCVLWHFAAMLTQDLPPEKPLCRMVQEELDKLTGGSVPCLYIPGCGANISFHAEKRQVAEDLASAIRAVMLTTPADPDVSFSLQTEEVMLAYKDFTHNRSAADIRMKLPEWESYLASELEKARAGGKRGVRATVSLLRINHLRMPCLPGMPFSELAAALKTDGTCKTICAAQVNANVGYIVPETSFAGGGFETWTAPWALVAKGASEFLSDLIQQMMKG